METNQLLYIGFIIYLTVMIFAYVFKIKWLIMVSGLLFFIPLTTIDNIFIQMISIIMIITHGIMGMYEKSEEDF